MPLLPVGSPAPDFTLPDQNKAEVKLSALKGQNVVLVFYPLDFSPVCTNEHCALASDFAGFEGANAQVFGISVDSVWAHKAFAEKHNLKYRLLADFHPKGKVCGLYGTWLEDKGLCGRATYVIDKEGIIRFAKDHGIPNLPDNKEILEALKKLS